MHAVRMHGTCNVTFGPTSQKGDHPIGLEVITRSLPTNILIVYEHRPVASNVERGVLF